MPTHSRGRCRRRAPSGSTTPRLHRRPNARLRPRDGRRGSNPLPRRQPGVLPRPAPASSVRTTTAVLPARQRAARRWGQRFAPRSRASARERIDTRRRPPRHRTKPIERVRAASPALEERVPRTSPHQRPARANRAWHTLCISRLTLSGSGRLTNAARRCASQRASRGSLPPMLASTNSPRARSAASGNRATVAACKARSLHRRC